MLTWAIASYLKAKVRAGYDEGYDEGILFVATVLDALVITIYLLVKFGT